MPTLESSFDAGTGCPAMANRPSCAAFRPVSRRASVVLPVPLSPMSAVTPAGIDTSTPSNRAGLPEYANRRPETASPPSPGSSSSSAQSGNVRRGSSIRAARSPHRPRRASSYSRSKPPRSAIRPSRMTSTRSAMPSSQYSR